MNFLKNMFDGKTLTIIDPEAVLKQKTTLNLFQAYFKSFWKITYTNGKLRFMERQTERIEKYRFLTP